MDYKTPLAKVRGLGSAHNGTTHWWMQRVSSILLIPLSFWLMAYLKKVTIFSHAEITAWLAEPLNSLGAILWLLTVFYHAALGLQVVMEDYIHSAGRKIVAIWAMKLGFLGMGLATILTVLRVILQ